MKPEYQVGLAMTSHNNSVSGSARFDHVQLIRPGERPD